MTHRFRFIGEKVDDSLWNLREDELHHIQKVLRLKNESEVEVTNGRGEWCVGTLGGKSVKVTEVFKASDSPLQAEICVGILKHHWFEEALPSIVETGISAVHVYAQTHTDKFIFTEKFNSRALKLIENACKQCKQANFPKIFIHKTLNDALKPLKGFEGVYFDMGQESSVYGYRFQSKKRFAVIGSEGGFTEDDLATLKAAQISPLKMGELTLRAFTASIVASSILVNA